MEFYFKKLYFSSVFFVYLCIVNLSQVTKHKKNNTIMKKTFLSLLAALAMAFGFSSCQHQTMETLEVLVYPNEWVTPRNSTQLVHTIRWNALDEDVVDFGIVNAYVIDDGVQNQLPYVYSVDYSGYDTNGNMVEGPFYVTENLRFEYGYGYISFIIEDFDFNVPEGELPIHHFRIVALGD